MAFHTSSRSAQTVELEFSDLAFPTQAASSLRTSRSQVELPDQSFVNRYEGPFVTEVEDVPPNGGYGWICAACVFMINAHTWGINSVSAVSYSHFARENGCINGQ